MPWCPKCESEYREGFKRCKDCDVDLVEQLDIAEQTHDLELEPIQYLTNVADDMESITIESS
ncbi:hypothetical protein [Tepidibacillus marianensis]|uniref:hypothetical protein n=1 Tax=Tepidibacillus marianensis TaxID=3131995 RepID=UPI0030CE2B49